MVEEMPAPGRYTPRAMCLAVAIGALSAFLFLAVCLACVQDMGRLLDPPSGFPFVELTRSILSPAAAAAIIALFVFNGLGQGVSIITSASRLTDLGPRLGSVVNAVSLIYCAITSVFFSSSPRPAPADMNYAIAVFGAMLVVALAFWFLQGRSTFMMQAEPALCADQSSGVAINNLGAAAESQGRPGADKKRNDVTCCEA